MLYVTSEVPMARTGDRMKTVLSCFLFSELLNGQLIYNKSWTYNTSSEALDFKPIIDEESYKYFFTAKPPKDCKEVIIEDRNFIGYSHEEFQSIKEKINLHRGETILLKFKGVCRLKLNDVLSWEKESKVKLGVCENVLNLLKKLYFFNKSQTKIENLVCIHLRRGDIFTNPLYEKTARIWEKDQGLEYYSNVIKQINNEFKNKNLIPKIEVHSEKLGSEDIRDLKNEENTTLVLGGPDDALNQFNRLCVAERLYTCNSGYSFLASLINPNEIFIPDFIKGLNFANLKHFTII